METVRPTDAESVAEAVQSARAEGERLEIMGAGTKRGLGRSVDADRTLATTGLSGITLYEPEELVMTAKTGTPLAEIQAALDEAGQHLAFEPLDYGPVLGGEENAQTLGGVLAANLSGPRRIAAGAARDHFLGVEAVTGYGEIIHAGGRVVKNVTGYDLCKLFAGSFGTLGILTEVTIKTLPAPAGQATLCLSGLDERDAVALMRRLVAESLEVSAAAHLPAWAASAMEAAMDKKDSGITAVRIDGFPASLKARRASLHAMLEDNLPAGGTLSVLEDAESKRFWQAMRRLDPCLSRPDDAVWRLSVPPASGAVAAEEIRAQMEAYIYYDWAGGLLWGAVPDLDEDKAAAIRGVAEKAGGHATLVRAAAETREKVAPFHPLPDAKAALSARIKTGFDPDGLLNPGRIYQGI